MKDDTCSGINGQPSSILYPTFEKTFTYDRRGRLVSETDHADGEALVTHFAYDAKGNLSSKTDRMGRTTYYAYDALDRLIQVTDPGVNQTRYVYDGSGNLLSLTDANGNVTGFEYDLSGRLTRQTRPSGKETRYGYDAAARLTERIDGKGQVTQYDYDDVGRLTQARYPDRTVNLTWNNANQLVGYTDGTTTGAYTYDPMGRKTSETVDYGPFALTTQITYYANGLKKSMTGPDGITYTYQYDANNQLATVQTPVGMITVNDYHWNRPEKMTLPGGTTRNFAYDALMRVKGITSKDPGGNPIADAVYTHDPMDKITAKATEHGPYTYGYDNLDRLTQVDNPALADEAYTYDALGNRLTSSDTAGQWSYDLDNALTGYEANTFVYDDNGNLIQKTVNGVVTRFAYDAENRLETVTDGAGNTIATYGYDPFNRRLWKDVAGTRTYFHYTDEGLAGEYDASGTPIRTYGFTPDSIWSTDPLFMRANGQYYFYHNDHLGTPQKMTSISGAVVWSATYTAFGKASIEVESVTNNLRFPGQYFDKETGLHYNWNRYYDPDTGRYLTTDPIGLEGGINLYAYVNGDPGNDIDESGLVRGARRRRHFSPLHSPYAAMTYHGLYREITRINPKYNRHKNPNQPITWGDVHELRRELWNAQQRAMLRERYCSGKEGGIPSNWIRVPSKSGGGIKFVDPTNPHNYVRIMPGNPKSPYPDSQMPYVRWQRNGQALDVNGRPVPKTSPDAHIPVQIFRYIPGD